MGRELAEDRLFFAAALAAGDALAALAGGDGPDEDAKGGGDGRLEAGRRQARLQRPDRLGSDGPLRVSRTAAPRPGRWSSTRARSRSSPTTAGSSTWSASRARPVGEAALLELPAGKLDDEGETPLECAQRELAEEIGKSAGDWRELKRFYTSPGFATEQLHLFLATELYEVPGEPEEEERIEIVRCPWTSSTRRSSAARTPKSLVGLLMLRDLL